MPRRSSGRTKASEDPSVEKRVTRRSLRGAAEPEPPVEAKKVTKSPAPSSRSRGRGRGRGGTQRRGRGAAEEEPAEKDTTEETAEEENDSSQEDVEEAPVSPTKKPSRGRAKTGRGRGRARGRSSKSDSPAEDVEEEPVKEKETKEVEQSPARSRRSRSAQNTPKKETPTPTRRGRRGRSSAAAEEEEKPASESVEQDEADEEKMEEVVESPSASKKRKRSSVENVPKEAVQTEKKQKVEDEEAESVEKEAEKSKPSDDEVPAESEEAMETETALDSSKETKKPEVEEPPEQKEEPNTETEGEESKPSEEASPLKDSSDEPKADSKITEPAAKSEEKIPSKPKPEQDSPTPIESEAEPAQQSKAESEPEQSQSTEPIKAASEEEKPAEEASEPKEEESMETDEVVKEDKTEEVLKDYVVIDMEDVPASDSAEVAKSTPSSDPSVESESKEPEPVPEVQATMPPEDEPDNEPEPKEVEEPKPERVAESKEGEQQSPEQVPESKEADQPRSEPVTPTNGSSTHLPNSTPEVNSNISNGTITNSVDSNTDALFSRKTLQNPHITLPVEAKQRFSLVSYNILADCHSLKNSTFYDWTSSEKLAMDARHKRLLQELQYLDADVICLQEVSPEYFTTTLTPSLKGCGYDGVFKRRLDCDEGEATFYRSERFQLVSHRGVALHDLALRELEACGLDSEKATAVKNNIDRPTVVLITQLKCNSTQTVVTIGNTHVSWDKLKRPDLQCIQAACAVKEVVAMADGPSNAHVLCGDFNSTPDSPVYQLMKEGYLNDKSLTTLQAMTNVQLGDGQSQALVNLWFKGFQHTSPNMRSSYKLVTGSEPVTTRYIDIRECKEADYIWCGGANLDVASVLSATPENLISTGIPNDVFPSDHLSLKAELFFK